MSGVLLLATLVWPDWIELVVGVDPDRGTGSLEWSIVAIMAVATITCSILARLEWRQTQQAT